MKGLQHEFLSLLFTFTSDLHRCVSDGLYERIVTGKIHLLPLKLTQQLCRRMTADPQPAVLERRSCRRQNLSSRIPPGSVRRRGRAGAGEGPAGLCLLPPRLFLPRGRRRRRQSWGWRRGGGGAGECRCCCWLTSVTWGWGPACCRRWKGRPRCGRPGGSSSSAGSCSPTTPACRGPPCRGSSR